MSHAITAKVFRYYLPARNHTDRELKTLIKMKINQRNFAKMHNLYLQVIIKKYIILKGDNMKCDAL